MNRLVTVLLAVSVASLAGAAWAGGGTARGVLIYAAVPDVGIGDPGHADGFAELFTVRTDGTGFRRLTRTTAWEYDPASSPNGRLVAYSRGEPYCHASSCEWGPTSSSIWVVTAAGLRPRAVTNAAESHENDWLEHSPAWSPDGRKLAFARTDNIDGKDPTNGIYVVGADGRGLDRVSRADAIDLAWSPRGGTIAYVHQWGGYVAILDVANGRARRLRMSGLLSAQSVAWSPGGRFLAVATGQAVYVVRAAGGRARKVAAWRGAGDVSWSTDGCCLAFSGMRPGTRYGRTDIYVVSVRGGRPRRLTSSRGGDFDPAWRP